MTSRRAVPEPDDASTTGDFTGSGLRRLLDVVPAGGTVLEIGSGPGRDIAVLEAHGLAVRRTDVTTALTDLGGPYDAVVALGVLRHLERAQMPSVLSRIAAALRPGGILLVAIREGDGEQWEVGDSRPSFTVLWLEPDFCDQLEDAGFKLDWRATAEDPEERPWLMLTARTRTAPDA
jgi:hypothetical protein